jgi:hypothetical protein
MFLLRASGVTANNDGAACCSSSMLWEREEVARVAARIHVATKRARAPVRASTSTI